MEPKRFLPTPGARVRGLLALLLLLGPVAGLRAQPSLYTQIGAGENYAVALRADGSLWAWGSKAYSQLGNGTTTGRVLPAQVAAPIAAAPGTSWAGIVTGYRHVLARRSDGTLWGWGDNYYGQLGDASTTSRILPVLVPVPTGAAAGTSWSAVATKFSSSLALRSDGTLWSWGDNAQGQLGSGTTTARSSAGPVAAPAGAPAGSTWTAVAMGYSHALALRSDGSLWTWGYNAYGQLGDNSTTSRPLPARVNAPAAAAAGTTWTAIAAGEYHSLGLRSDGTLWAWGFNNYGQLGDASTTFSQLPVAVITPGTVGAGTTWTRVVAGVDHTAALRSDGSLWVWGRNDSGQFGNNTIVSQSTPTRETGNSTWSQLSAGRYNTQAVQAGTGLVFGTGFNGFGQLGNGTTTDSRLFLASAAPVLATRPAAAPLTGVYPNPATASCQLPALPPGAVVTLRDLHGRLVRKAPAAPTLGLAGLAPGLYWLTAQAPGVVPRTMRLAVE